MTLKRIRLELARDHDFPSGSRERGYDFIAPLDDSGHLSIVEFKDNRERCRVRRDTCAFDYDPTSDKDDEPGFKLDQHRLVPGEYISITEQDGVQRTFFIKAVVELD
jgi:hypothetical protein